MSELECNSMRERIVEEIYEEISSADRARLETHLAACASCRREIDRLREARAALREGRPEVPAPVPSRVIVLGRPPAGRLARATRLAAAAVIVALALLSLFQARFTRGPEGAAISFGPSSPTAEPNTTNVAAVREEIRTAVDALREGSAADYEILAAAFGAELDRRDAVQARAEEASFSWLVDEIDRRRQQDLAFLLARIGTLEYRTGQEVARANQLLEYAVRTGSRRPATER